jgi:uncharacterized protein with PQ loop repeat
MESMLGYLAATLTMVTFLPQIIRLYKTRNAEVISV